MKLSRIAPLAAAALLLAACGQSPTAPAAAPSAPSLDGTSAFGSGGRSESSVEGGNYFGGGSYSDPGATTTSDDEITPPENGRGTNSFGSGG